MGVPETPLSLPDPRSQLGYLPETRHVVQLGYGVFCIFMAFTTQGFFATPVIKSNAIDNRAAANYPEIIYCVIPVATLFAAPVVDLLSAKWAMMAGGICYALFMIGFFFLSEVYLYITAALVGIGAALIWTGQGTYLSRNSTVEKSGRNSATVWGMLQASMFAGGIFLFVTSLGGGGGAVPRKTSNTLYLIFTAITIVGTVIMAFLPTPPAHLSPFPRGYRPSIFVLIFSTFKVMLSRNMLILAIVFAYTGIQQYFWMNIYPKSVGSTKAFGWKNPNSLVGLNAILMGLGQWIACCVFAIIYSKKPMIGRHVLVLLGAIIHLVSFVLIFINFPDNANLVATDKSAYIKPSVAIALVTGFLLGFGDACWNSQVYAHLVSNYHKTPSQAFAIYNFWKSALTCACFFYAPSLLLPWHLLILVVFMLLSTVAFFIVERMSNHVENRGSYEQFTTQNGESF